MSDVERYEYVEAEMRQDEHVNRMLAGRDNTIAELGASNAKLIAEVERHKRRIEQALDTTIELRRKLKRTAEDRDVFASANSATGEIERLRAEKGRQCAYIVELEAKLAEAESHRDRLFAVVQRQEAQLARVMPVVGAARAYRKASDALRKFDARRDNLAECADAHVAAREAVARSLDALATTEVSSPSGEASDSSSDPSTDDADIQTALAIYCGKCYVLVSPSLLAKHNEELHGEAIDRPSVNTCTVCGRAIDKVVGATGYLWRHTGSDVVDHKAVPPRLTAIQAEIETWDRARLEREFAEMTAYVETINGRIVKAIGILDDSGRPSHRLYSAGVEALTKALYAVLEPDRVSARARWVQCPCSPGDRFRVCASRWVCSRCRTEYVTAETAADHA